MTGFQRDDVYDEPFPHREEERKLKCPSYAEIAKTLDCKRTQKGNTTL